MRTILKRAICYPVCIMIALIVELIIVGMGTNHIVIQFENFGLVSWIFQILYITLTLALAETWVGAWKKDQPYGDS